jgi:hypothetical protein
MKYVIGIASKIIILIVFFLLSSCAKPAPMHTSIAEPSIDMGNYRVSPPPGDGWQVDIERENGTSTVTFMKLKLWWTGRVLGSTLIRVFKDTVKPDSWHLSEEQVANNVRSTEEKIMIKEGVEKGIIELKDVEKETEIISGKKFYTMTYKTSMGSFLGGVLRQGTWRSSENKLYLYFPPNFNDEHIFYGFLIGEEYEKGALVEKVNLAQIYPVINSFELVNDEEKK